MSDVALASMSAGDAVGERPIRVDGEVPGDDVYITCALMIAGDAVGDLTIRREGAARQFHAERARLPVVADGDTSRVRGHVGGGEDRDVTCVAIACFGGRYPDGAIATAFRVPGQAVEIIAGSLTIVVEDEVIGEPDCEVAVRLIGTVEDVAVFGGVVVRRRARYFHTGFGGTAFVFGPCYSAESKQDDHP